MKRITFVIALFLGLSVLIGGSFSSADTPGGVEFLAGAASVEITPDVGARAVPLNGYGARKGAPATGVHDPLYAKALIIESRDRATGKATRAALVTTDLCMVNLAMRKSVLGQIGNLGIGDANFIMTASHTHSGPAALDPRFPAEMIMGKFDPILFEGINARIAGAVREASGKLAPAKLGVSQQEFPALVRSRRVAGYSYETRRFAPDAGTKPVDAMMSLIRVTAADGSPIAALVVIGSHPTILGADNMKISADWPGVMQRELRNSIGGNVVAMFSNGAEGDQAPPSIGAGDDFTWMEWYGRQVAAAAKSLWDKASGEAGVLVTSAVFDGELPPLHIRKFFSMPIPRTLTRSVASQAKCVAIRAGPVALIGLPGEAVSKVALDIRGRALRMGVPNPVVVGLANDWIGYIADPETYREGGYEASMTLFGENESSVIITSAINALAQALSSR